MAYNSKDTGAFKGVWVFCEQRDGVILGTGYQLLSEGRKLADDLGVELCGVLLGSGVNEQYAKAQPIKDAKAWEETSKRLPRQWQEALIINMQ